METGRVNVIILKKNLESDSFGPFIANNEIIEVKEDSLEIYFFQISSVNRGTFYLSVR